MPPVCHAYVAAERPWFRGMGWLLDAAVALNGGRRRGALERLSERLDVHVDTVRRWNRGDREAPKVAELAVRGLVEIELLRGLLNRVTEAVDGVERRQD